MTERKKDLRLEELSRTIVDKMGLYFPSQRFGDLERIFQRAAKDLGYATVDACINWFLEEPQTRTKLEKLAVYLTIGETYFFREYHCFEVIEQIVLPEIIRRDRSGQKRLRIWSAGCASGEEPYSIAIMLHRMRHMLKGWDIAILATDINMLALEKAMAGVYSSWSFRNSPEWLMSNYFNHNVHGKYELIPEIKNMVNFRYLNLVEDAYPSVLNDTNALDILFCRNVLMYFTQERVQKTLQRFNHCLVDEGIMVVSSCETPNLGLSGFAASYYPDVILYRKTTQPPSITRSMRQQGHLPVTNPAKRHEDLKPMLHSTSGHKISKAHGDDGTLEQATELYRNGNYRESEALVSELLRKNRKNVAAVLLLCRICANEGRLGEAKELSEEAILLDKLNPGIHFVNAMILFEQDRSGAASEALRRTLYLDNRHIAAHYLLGNISRATGRTSEASRHYRNALELLEQYDPDAEVPDSEGMIAGKFAEMIRITLGNAQDERS